MIESYMAVLKGSGKYKRPLSVDVVPFTKFWPAEDYHQDYVQHHPENSYVQHESIPRFERATAQLKDLLKTNGQVKN